MWAKLKGSKWRWSRLVRCSERPVCVSMCANWCACVFAQAVPSLLPVSTEGQLTPAPPVSSMFYSSQLKQLAFAQFWHSAIKAVTTRSISNFAVATAAHKRGGKMDMHQGGAWFKCYPKSLNAEQSVSVMEKRCRCGHLFSNAHPSPNPKKYIAFGETLLM